MKELQFREIVKASGESSDGLVDTRLGERKALAAPAVESGACRASASSRGATGLAQCAIAPAGQ